VYIAGDSTVTDQGGEPYTGWGQVLPRFFSDHVAVSNHAESGRALYSFRGERRLDKILSTIKPGDYLLIQFGHNDQKNKAPGSGAFTTYKADLEQYVKAAREKGATPVIVTPMYRRRFDSAGKLENSLGDFPAAARKIAGEQKVLLVDLHEMSGKVFQALGEEGSKQAFLFYPAGTVPGQDKEIKDNSHFSAYGAYELARCVVEAIRTSDLPLAKRLAGDVRPFDPSHPDDPGSVNIPRSPARAASRPEGS
jgi:lysophospholipase L1-like esterase